MEVMLGMIMFALFCGGLALILATLLNEPILKGHKKKAYAAIAVLSIPPILVFFKLLGLVFVWVFS